MPVNDGLKKLAVGGSEAAAPLGVHDYITEHDLWVRKKFDLPPEEPTPEMKLGTYLQQPIAFYAAELAGYEIEWRDETCLHPDYPFMAYTPDAVVIGQRRGVDAKYVSWHQAWRWAHTPPDHAVVQAWYYMAALDYDFWDLAVLVAGESQPRIYTIERNRWAEKKMLERVRIWWERYLIGDEEPPITASPTTNRWLHHLYPKHRPADIQDATDQEIVLLDEFAALYKDTKRLDKYLQTLEAKLKAAIGDHEGLRWPGGKVTWKRITDGVTVNWEGLCQLLLHDHPAAEKLVKEFSSPKPGSRRLLFKSARGGETEL